MWIERQLKQKIIQMVTSRPAILLTGARQTGKTSLLQRLFPDVEYLSFDYLRHVEAVIHCMQPWIYLNRIKLLAGGGIEYCSKFILRLACQATCPGVALAATEASYEDCSKIPTLFPGTRESKHIAHSLT